MILSFVLAVAATPATATVSLAPCATLTAPRPQQEPQQQQSQPAQQLEPIPSAPLGETASPVTLPVAELEVDMGGNPAPVPETRFLLERLLGDTGFWQPVADAGIRVYGWTQGNYTASSADRWNTPVAFNDRADFLTGNQNWLEVVREVDTSKNELQVGGRVAMILPGYDSKFTRARGLFDEQTDRYGFDPTYFYAELFLPDVQTTVRVGRWGTLIGYEMIEAIATPFVSRSYNFQYNPFTHTGVMATTTLGSGLTMYHGVVTGADVFFDPAATPAYVGGLKWTSDSGATSISGNVFITGEGYDAGEAFQHYDSYNVLFMHELASGWNYALDSTLGRAPDSAGSNSQTLWYGFANYLAVSLTDDLLLNLRVEAFHDDDGVRTGTAGDYTEETAGLQYTANEWLLVRPFVRHDHGDHGAFEGHDDLWSGGLEMIARW